MRDGDGILHLYTNGANNFNNGIRVWRFTEDSPGSMTGSWGSKYGTVLSDPPGSGSAHTGCSYGIWGSGPSDIYVVGWRSDGDGDTTPENNGRVYHFNGTVWELITDFGDIPSAYEVWGSGPDDVWVSLSGGHLLHYGAVNQPPVLTVDNAVITVDEGQEATNTGASDDLDGDTVTLEASVGTLTLNGYGTWSWNLLTTDGLADSQTVTITADDDNGGSDEATFNLTVNNVAPTVHAVDVPIDPVQLDMPVNATAHFSDPATDADAPYAATFNYGDNSGEQAGTVVNSTCTGPDHSYDSAGIYMASATVTDKDGVTGSAVASAYIVVYDPDGGFVTGGGWIDSPEGAYTPDPTLSGKATFGFVSKYKKGADEPTGQTQFEFKVADLNFHSGTYEWLVVNQNGTNAQFKGSGTINGDLAPNGEAYKFMLWATDGDPDLDDTFRIKIWYDDGVDEIVVYDNGFDQPIDGGSIVVHTKTKK